MPIHQVPKTIAVTIPSNPDDSVRLITFTPDDNIILRHAIVEIYFKGMPNLEFYNDPDDDDYYYIDLMLCHGQSAERGFASASSSVKIKEVVGQANSYVAMIRFDFNNSYQGIHLQSGAEYSLFGKIYDFERDGDTTYVGFVHDWSDIHGVKPSMDTWEFKAAQWQMPIKTALFGIKSGVTYTL